MFGYISFFNKFQEGLNMNTYMLFILICTNVIAHPCFPFPTISCLYTACKRPDTECRTFSVSFFCVLIYQHLFFFTNCRPALVGCHYMYKKNMAGTLNVVL